MYERSRKHSRSRSPDRHNHEARRSSPRRHRQRDSLAKALPYSARELTKHDLSEYKALFALYLDIQKRLDIEDLAESEIKGRWKSFIHKWNRGELANGWYDPATLNKALAAAEQEPSSSSVLDDPKPNSEPTNQNAVLEQNQDDEDDDFGPALPHSTQLTKSTPASGSKSGPTIPTLDDLRTRNEDARLSAEEAQENRLKALKHERLLDRKSQKERLEDLVPRAEPGTRERQLEKRRDLASSNRAFAASAHAAGDVELPDNDVMGGDDLSDLKRRRVEEERRKTEREVKREEILRARAAEREERTQRMREKEERTMGMLRELARGRFGDGNERGATLRED